MKFNPDYHTYIKPHGYKDLGWQLHIGNSDEVKKCHDMGHRRKQFDNSLYLNRCTEAIYICDECKNIYHIDMSD